MSILPSISIAPADHVLGTELLRVSCMVDPDGPQMYLNAYFNGTTYALVVSYGSGNGQPGFEETVLIPGWLRIRDLITTLVAEGVWKYSLAWEMSPAKSELPLENDAVLNLTVQEIQEKHNLVLIAFRRNGMIYHYPPRPSVRLAGA